MPDSCFSIPADTFFLRHQPSSLHIHGYSHENDPKYGPSSPCHKPPSDKQYQTGYGSLKVSSPLQLHYRFFLFHIRYKLISVLLPVSYQTFSVPSIPTKRHYQDYYLYTPDFLPTPEKEIFERMQNQHIAHVR